MSQFQKIFTFAVFLSLVACSSGTTGSLPTDEPVVLASEKAPAPTSEKVVPTPTTVTVSKSSIPNFDHIAIIMFENQEFDNVIGNSEMPTFNKLANEHTLLTRYYAVRHPSLPNYIALMGGDTFGITENCKDCFVDAPSLPDLIEASGRTWKTYQEDMPEPCFVGSEGDYEQKHNPFIYFNPIRLDKPRCEKSIVPFSMLQTDIDAGSLPNFIFITPNICNDGHDCPLGTADQWLSGQLDTLIPALDKDGSNYLLVMMFEEGDSDDACCGLPEGDAGGRVPVILLSPLAKTNFQDRTAYSHYSLLKTMADAWGLTYLGHAADAEATSITAPWK